MPSLLNGQRSAIGHEKAGVLDSSRFNNFRISYSYLHHDSLGLKKLGSINQSVNEKGIMAEVCFRHPVQDMVPSLASGRVYPPDILSGWITGYLLLKSSSRRVLEKEMIVGLPWGQV